MSRWQPRLGLIQETLLLTLYARALDARLPCPILGDTLSADLADRIDYDFGKLKLKPNLVLTTALRAKKLDDVVRAFTAAHPGCVVLDLGCGLDTRMLRCDLPPGVDWYDVDFPEVVKLRSECLPDGSHLVGADLTTSGWLKAVPGERPAMIVAEGLLPFMPGDSFQRMTRELAGRFPSGELALNGYTRFAAWAMKYHPTIKALGIKAAQGFDDPHEPESWGAGLELVEEQILTHAPEVAQFPQPLRALTRLTAPSTALSRQGARILRYRF
ncbi:class I SAM-dependent methyltransferase [Nonomuraea angiospora]|uniref:class I SAM-dependent methyltransferase n=1 Tax=Nonomuraea angiospora TaxID=46172 RepID=UPI0029B88BBB|nr:class I SAM-dependent methyltransferase [Nonomuraea angiospora]MDX3100358.1 class I SAM-dependent methyltransferase [Nonomuraea angiospora]